jgi:hypothetical protein
MDRLRWLPAVLALALAGCDWVWDVEATVTVEPTVQDVVTSWPQQVLLRHERIASNAEVGPAVYRVAVLCEPPAAPVVATWRTESLNLCGELSPVTAWLEPLDPDAGLPCGPVGGEGDPMDPALVPPGGAPGATGFVFGGHMACRHHDALALSIGAPLP